MRLRRPPGGLSVIPSILAGSLLTRHVDTTRVRFRDRDASASYDISVGSRRRVPSGCRCAECADAQRFRRMRRRSAAMRRRGIEPRATDPPVRRCRPPDARAASPPMCRAASRRCAEPRTAEPPMRRAADALSPRCADVPGCASATAPPSREQPARPASWHLARACDTPLPCSPRSPVQISISSVSISAFAIFDYRSRSRDMHSIAIATPALAPDYRVSRAHPGSRAARTA
jgi:hypothetical protein